MHGLPRLKEGGKHAIHGTATGIATPAIARGMGEGACVDGT